MVADLHWGKAEIFQQAGIPISSAILQEDLERLQGLVEELKIQRLVLLGDLMHGTKGLTTDVQETVRCWRQSLPCDILFIKGNHDRNLILPPDWEMQVVNEPFEDGPFFFSHHPDSRPSSYTWCGHLHPVIHIGNRREHLRLPCFWLQEHCGVLPSFGTFTGGYSIRPARKDSVLAIAEQSVFCLQ
jgi:DNA ligase-associated metallophosphoesterase